MRVTSTTHLIFLNSITLWCSVQVTQLFTIIYLPPGT